MIQVNLLPPENRPTKAQPHPAYSIFMTLTAFILILILSNHMFAILRYKKQYEIARANLSAAQKTNQKADEIQKDIQDVLQPGMSAQLRMTSLELNWAQVLNILADLLPANIWLSEMVIEDNPDGWEFTLKGFALPVPRMSTIGVVGEFTAAVKGAVDSLLEADHRRADIAVLTTTKRKLAERLEITEFTTSYTRTHGHGATA